MANQSDGVVVRDQWRGSWRSALALAPAVWTRAVNLRR